MNSVSFFLSVALVVTAAGCSSSNPAHNTADANTQDPSSDAADPTKNDEDTSSNPDAGPGSDEDDFESCAQTTAEARQENATSNLIIAVDTSGSMRKETEMVQLNINDRFSEKFGSKPEVEVHIVLIAKELDDPEGRGDGMCVSAPLGSGQCPNDTNPDKLFWHIHETVGSHDSLQVFIDCYAGGPSGTRCDEEGHWKDFISLGGFVHFVVVSDDDSRMTADEFETFAKATFGQNYMFHGIVSGTDSRGDNITPECDEYAANEGTVYKDLITRTGGVFGDLCLQENNEFDTVFDQITTEVITHVAMPCEWIIPVPPDGTELDPTKVNVAFTDGNTTEKIGKVDSTNKCDQVSQGWYYNDEDRPTKIFICPQTCDWIQGKPDASMQIKFGCKSEDAWPI